MDEAEKVIILKWLWFSEAHFENVYQDKLNNLTRLTQHSLTDYLNLYEAELKLRHFREFAGDLQKILL